MAYCLLFTNNCACGGSLLENIHVGKNNRLRPLSPLTDKLDILREEEEAGEERDNEEEEGKELKKKVLQ